MADVTISSLPIGTPSGSAVLPYSTGSSTLATAVSSLPYKIGFNVYELQNGMIIRDTTIITFSQTAFAHNCISPVNNLNRFQAPITGLYRFTLDLVQYQVAFNAQFQYSFCYHRKNGINEIVNGSSYGTYNSYAYSSAKSLSHSTNMFLNKDDLIDVVYKCVDTDGYLDNRRTWSGYLVYPY